MSKPHDEERQRFEDLLRKRGVAIEGNAGIEREILERYQDDCAVLIMDSCGFTRITKKHGIIHFMSMIIALRDSAWPIFERHQAYGYWAEADNIYATFPTAKMALEAAIDLQNAVKESNAARKPPERLKVGIGIGSGRLLRIGRSDALGDQMNQASKLGEDLAEADDILLTKEAFEEVRGKIPGLEVEPQMKNVSGVELQYYKVVRQED